MATRVTISGAITSFMLYTEALTALGFNEGEPEIPTPHRHAYREEFDADSRALLEAAQWHHSPLRPEDEQ